ncbi:hypothetical protein BJ912DRAFT_983132 [Pholiota molesta]|nr:hypothetical protein BJ912DRAFT_983132 [Pholiota molesta]
MAGKGLSSGAIGCIWALVNASSDPRETPVTESSRSCETFGGDTQDDVGMTSSLARTSLPICASPLLCFESQGPFCVSQCYVRQSRQVAQARHARQFTYICCIYSI